MHHGVDGVRDWLLGRIEAITDLPVSHLKGMTKIDDLGLDSITRASLVLEIEGELGCMIKPDALFEYPTVQALAEYIAAIRAGGGQS
jgi:acyl carrier protein